jgi:hypothetical protein
LIAALLPLANRETAFPTVKVALALEPFVPAAALFVTVMLVVEVGQYKGSWALQIAKPAALELR